MPVDTTTSPRRRPRAVVAAIGVILPLALLAALLALAVVLRPALGLGLLLGVLVGVGVRLILARRRKRHAPRERGVADSEERSAAAPPAAARRPAPAPGRGAGLGRVLALVVGAVVAVLAVGAVGLNVIGGPAANLQAPHLDGGVTNAGPETVHRYQYVAALTFQPEGDWAGDEAFLLSTRQAKALAGRGAGTVVARLNAILPSPWTTERQVDGETVVYRIGRRYPSHPFDVPGVLPALTKTSLPAPVLDGGRLRHPLYAGRGSWIRLVSDARRIHDSDPAADKPTETVHRIALDPTGSAGAGSGVELNIVSDWATHLDPKLLDDDVFGLIFGILSVFGFSLAAIPGKLAALVKAVIKKLSGGDPKRTASVLRGTTHKDGALRAYLRGRELEEDEIETATAWLVHAATEFAGETIDGSTDPADIRDTYNAARAQLKAEHKTGPLDTIYRALRAAGVPDAECLALDDDLDRRLIDRFEPEPDKAGEG